ncbi:MAG: nicotinate phosphoribosyltransferase [Erysipelotrichaceae bacterium]|nr:nicotinate phosphoribosyltransferase [Erysipelotrichaceae bacterium]
MKDGRNLSLVMDFYELTMSQVYFNNGNNEEVVFDLFYRRNPENGGFAIFAGLEQVIEYVQDLKFDKEQIDYLRSTGIFTEPFLEYLSTVRFTGDLWSVPEGTPVFPYEPLVRVKAPLIEAQLVETALLLALNHQTLIATKARRIVQSAEGRTVMEFGARRAHNFDSAVYGARAAYIAGVDGTATTQAGMAFGIPALGTMAHSFVQSYPTEYDAFLAYAKSFPDSCTLLIDTYNTVKSGVVNAVKVAKDYLEPNGHRLAGVRIDSGDIAYLSKKVRKYLDEHGCEDCKIVVSNSLDEYLIESLLDHQGAKIDSFGVGENLIVSKNSPVFGGVYKLCAVEDKDGNMEPRIKLSENEEKITNPGFKDLYRIYNKEDGKAIADLMTLHNEKINLDEDLTIYHPMNKWKNKVIEGGTYILRSLLVPVFINGKLVYDAPTLDQIRQYCTEELNTLWDEIKRFTNPQEYYVDLSETLLDLKLDMIKKLR